MRNQLAVVTVLSLLLSSSLAAADDGWSLTTADFKRQTVTLRSISGKGITVLPYGADQPVEIPFSRLLQLDRGGVAQQLRGNWILHLASGDRIGGDPLNVTGDNLVWNSVAAGKVEVPLKEIRGFARAQESPKFDPQRTEDAVYLANGDSIKGIITGLENGKLQVKQASGEVLAVDLQSARSIHFAASGQAAAGAAQGFRVQLADGSVLTGAAIATQGDQLILSDSAGQQQSKRQIALSGVILIEQVNGPVSWLSARPPDEALCQPMLGVSFPPQMDRNYRGEKIRFGNRDYARGIGVHAWCRLTWKLDGSFPYFRTQYSLNEDAYKGRVTVRILLDGKVVHEARDFGPGKLSPVLLIELGNAKTLTLEAHPGGETSASDPARWNIDTQARLNWIEPALLKEKSAAESPRPATAPATTRATRSAAS